MKKRSFRIYLILTLLWTAGIFLHSAMPAAASNAESGGVLAVVQMILPVSYTHLTLPTTSRV